MDKTDSSYQNNQNKEQEVDFNVTNVLFHGLRKRDKLFYSIGHVLNDMCASMWFTYLLLYFHMVLKMEDLHSGLLLLIGQIADGVSTIFVGVESDRHCIILPLQKYGKRKAWHLIGTICVALTFPFIFNRIPGDKDSEDTPSFFYYAVFIVVFQFGWAATQISHLSLIPDLSDCTVERTELNAYRYAWTVIANIFVYAVTWLMLRVHNTCSDTTICPHDDFKFRNLVLIVVGVGSLFSILFHIFVNESKFEICQMTKHEKQSSVFSVRHKTWRCWFKQVSFYQVGLLYMSTRLFCNVFQSFVTLYMQESLKLPMESVAYIPLIIFGSGFISSLVVKIVTVKIGKKRTYFVGCLIGSSAALWIYFGRGKLFDSYFIFAVAVFFGIGSSTMLVTALGIISDMIGRDVKSSAFVFGFMSFLDKLSSGAAIMLIQAFHPCTHPCAYSGPYYRDVLGIGSCIHVGLAMLCILSLIPVKFNVVNMTTEEEAPILRSGTIQDRE